MKRKLLQILMGLALTCAMTLAAAAQTSTAELRGQVVDQSDAVIPGAKVTLTDTGKGTARTVNTDAEGNYTFLNILPGEYEIKAEAANFAPGRLKIALTVGEAANLPIKLTAGEVTATVDVVAGGEAVETERTQQSSTIESRQIQNLPISRRNYLDYALLTPGVTDSDNIADASDFRVAQTPQSGLSFGGSNGRGNSVAVDGVDVSGASGGVRGTVSQEAVQEFQVLRNSFNAEFGGASGGAINIVSKTGGNQFHGSVFGYFRSKRFDARNAFDFNPRGKSDFDRQQFGGSLGGPLKQDKTFFFGAFERFSQGQTTFVNLLNPNNFRPTTGPLGQQALFSFLAGTPFAAAAAGLNSALTTTSTNYPRTVNLFTNATGQFPFDSNQTQGSFRMDHVFSDRSNGYARVNFNDSAEENQAAGALTAVSRGRTFDILGGDFLVSHNYQFSDTLFNEFKAQFGYQRLNVIPNDAIGPEFNIEGAGNFNRDIFLPSQVITRHYDYVDNITKLAGRHTIKAGLYFNFVRNTTDSETFFPARFNFGAAIPLAAIIQPSVLGPLNTFLRTSGGALGADANGNGLADSLDQPMSALQAFNFGLPTVYQQGFGTSDAASWTNRISYYVQDTWKVAPNFTLNYGLRYYVSNEPFLLPTYKGDLQPRVGFSWDPFKQGKTVLRAGAGIFVGAVNNAVANVTFKQAALGRPSDINIVIATPTTNNFGLPRSFDVYQALLVLTNNFSRPIRLADLANILPPTAPAGVTRRPIVPGPNSTLEVRFRREPNYRSPTTYQASAGLQQELGGGFTLELSYLFTRGLYLTRNRDINQFKRTGAPNSLNRDGGATFIRFPAAGTTSDFLNPLRLQDNIYESSANSFYHAGTIQVLKRFGNNVGLNAHYTWAKAIDEVTDFNSDFSAQNPLNLRLDRAVSAFDQRHRMVISGIFASPYHGDSTRDKVLGGWQFSPIFTAGSGRPFNLLLGFDANGDGRSQSDRPGQAARNTGLGASFYSLDTRLSRRFFAKEGRYLELTFEGFNVFNRINFAGINNVISTTFIGVTDFRARGNATRAPTEPLGFTSAADARKLQFGARFNF